VGSRWETVQHLANRGQGGRAIRDPRERTGSVLSGHTVIGAGGTVDCRDWAETAEAEGSPGISTATP